MANLNEVSDWTAGIYQLEEEDPVQGGAGGIDNLQAQQLANRTAYLKTLVDALTNGTQPLDGTLTALAGLVGAADKLAYFNGADSAALTTLTAFARSLLASFDAAAARVILGVVTQAQVDASIAALVDSSPTLLDTLNELAAALGDDPNFAATVTAALASKAALDVPQSFTKGQRGAEFPLPATTGSVALNLEASNNWGGTLTGDITLSNPSAMPVGQSGVIRIVNGAMPRTIAYGSYWKGTSGLLPGLTAESGATDDLVYYVESATRVLIASIGDVK